MRRTPSTRAARGVFAGVVAGLLVLMIEDGLWSVVEALTILNFAPEIGPIASFVVSSLVATAYFVPPFLLIACPCLWLVRETPGIGPWVATVAAALVVAGTVSVMSAAWLHDSRRDTKFIVALSVLPAGIGAGVALRSWNASAGRGDEPA